MSNTREKILAHTLERFNNEGVESVGIRDLARDLGLSPGNVSYHFKKKDDLVAELARRLSERNASTLSSLPTDLTAFFEAYRTMLRNHIEYRFLMVSIVYLFEHNEHMEGTYAAREKTRRQVIFDRICELRGRGLREALGDDEIRTLVAHLTLIVRMWMTEKRISFPEADDDAAINHYLHLLADIFLPHTTPAGQTMLEPYLRAPLLA